MRSYFRRQSSALPLHCLSRHYLTSLIRLTTLYPAFLASCGTTPTLSTAAAHTLHFATPPPLRLSYAFYRRLTSPSHPIFITGQRLPTIRLQELISPPAYPNCCFPPPNCIPLPSTFPTFSSPIRAQLLPPLSAFSSLICARFLFAALSSCYPIRPGSSSFSTALVRPPAPYRSPKPAALIAPRPPLSNTNPLRFSPFAGRCFSLFFSQRHSSAPTIVVTYWKRPAAHRHLRFSILPNKPFAITCSF